MTLSEIKQFVEHFPKKHIGSKTVEEVLSYENLSFWWLFKNRLEGNHLPTIFPNMEQISDAIEQKRIIKSSLKSKLLKKMFYLNERLKQIRSKGATLKKIESKKKVLCVIPSTRVSQKNDKQYVDRLNEVLNEIKKRKDIDCQLELYEPLSRKANFLKNNLFYKYTSKKILKEAKASSKKIHKQWGLVKKQLVLQPQEKKIFDLYLPAFEFIFSQEMMFWSIVYYKTFEKIIDEQKTDLILLDCSGSIIERALIQIAKAKNIPCLRLLHGGLYYPDRPWEYPDNVYMCIHNQDLKKHMISLGAKQENIIVTGATFLEELPEIKNNYRDEKQVLLCTTSLVEESIMNKEKYFDIIKNILLSLNFISKRQKLRVVIKLHPSETNRKEYEKIVKDIHLKTEIIECLPKKELYQLIGQSDIVITFWSTIILESNLLNKPTFLVDYEEQRGQAEKRFQGIKPYILLSPEKSEELIEAYLYDKDKIDALEKNRKEFIEHFFYKLDGKVHERVVDVIEDLTSQYS